ncbi:Fur-regulated basic protein FbpA [Alkalihalobacillus sp. MEB130]|uniref:Fur-regulated basic protein FbpA n=1 Tax=Alkalihalobacillus sp. MEB130 TaxID=2976704 RepID=UPI0028DEB7A3|nr:Fur-regulated basic protein FbpA [Alkalihalobacillus sp. MEB130]MDT8858664.1 Fur-regulated basic protein FbpA [Alkalihalobacillus sp. MEB130]
MSFETLSQIDKAQIIDTLLEHQFFKMPDGRQLYEATEEELRLLICSQLEQGNDYTFL